MPSFDARLRLPGQNRLPLNVVVDVSDERIAFTMGQETLGEWALQEISVETRPDGFHITLDQEEVILTVTDPVRFAGELGIVQHRDQITANTDSPADHPDGGHNGTAVGGGIAQRLIGVDPEEQFAEVRRRISALATALTDDSIAPADLFGRWLRLLKEINRRHGQGAMPTVLFYRLNTELLDLIPAPESTPPQAVVESRQERIAQP